MTLITVGYCTIRYEGDFYNNIVYCIKSVNSLFMKNVCTHLIRPCYRVVGKGGGGSKKLRLIRRVIVAPCIGEGSGVQGSAQWGRGPRGSPSEAPRN